MTYQEHWAGFGPAISEIIENFCNYAKSTDPTFKGDFFSYFHGQNK